MGSGAASAFGFAHRNIQLAQVADRCITMFLREGSSRKGIAAGAQAASSSSARVARIRGSAFGVFDQDNGRVLAVCTRSIKSDSRAPSPILGTTYVCATFQKQTSSRLKAGLTVVHNRRHRVHSTTSHTFHHYTIHRQVPRHRHGTLCASKQPRENGMPTSGSTILQYFG